MLCSAVFTCIADFWGVWASPSGRPRLEPGAVFLAMFSALAGGSLLLARRW